MPADAGAAYKYPLLLSFLLITGCAFGQVSVTKESCTMKGLAVGRARLHATCYPGKSFETPIPEEPKIAMPIAGCSGNYNYHHECIDDEGNVVPKDFGANPGNLARAKADEGYVEISGGSPTTGFWSGVFDLLLMAGTIAAAKFGI